MKIPSIERTFVMLKPDSIKRGLVGDIFNRFERVGLKLVACRMIMASEEQAKGNYPGTESWMVGMGNKTLANYDHDIEAVRKDMGTADPMEIGAKIYTALVKYLTEGPIIIMVWEGNHAVRVVEKLVGKTDPTLADLGSIRGDYAFDTPQFAVKSGRIVFKTLMHRSDSAEEAVREIKHWFGAKYKDLSNYKRTDYIDSYGVFE